ncbi:MAG TPA: uroporphyrinogen-III synthase [Emcibacteraceae bacterium]|nr:uroporphyrinogen-III synthase [Emcibacteraceae bacterium]
MNLLLTRPLNESKALAEQLRRQNITVYIDPLMSVKYLPIEPDIITNHQAIILTSGNAVKALEYFDIENDFPIYTVGNKTANLVKMAGQTNVISADGDEKILSDLIKNELSPDNGPLLYLCGVHRTGKLAETLINEGFQVKCQEVYRMDAVSELNESSKILLNSRAIDFIPFYSARSAIIFKRLISTAGMDNTLATITALCLSPAIKKELSSLSWKEIITAKRPTQSDLFKLIKIDL